MGVWSQNSPVSAEEHLTSGRAAGGMHVLMLTRCMEQKHVSEGARTLFLNWMGVDTLALEDGGVGQVRGVF